MSTSLEGFGATRPPPITYILLQKVSPRVSPVALGIGAIVPMVLVEGVNLNELVVSTTASTHLEPTAALGSNDHIWFVEATLMLNPPRIYILLPVSAKPPGRIVPIDPGQLSPAPSVTTISVVGL